MKNVFYDKLFYIVLLILFIVNFDFLFAASTVVISPNGGENWVVGSNQTIQWTSAGATKVNIFYSTNDGTTWNYIAFETSNTGSYNWVIPNTVSDFCRVKVVNSANQNDFDVSNNLFSIKPQQNPTWQSYIKIKDSLNYEGLLHFGQAINASDGIDLALGEFELPPVPLSGIFDTRFTLPTNPALASLRDYRNDSLKQIIWIMNFQSHNNYYPINFQWSNSNLPLGTFFLKDVSGTLININMKEQNSFVLNNPNITQLKIEFSKTICKDIAVLANWNLVSVPLKMSNMTPASVFPTKTSPAYGYLNGYFEVDTFKNAKGYWLKFANSQSINLCGEFTGLSSVPINSGWNLIGVFDKNISVGDITTSPSGILTSPFYGYENGYINSNSLLSGKGYWIKSSQSGTINLPTNSLFLKSNNQENLIFSEAKKIIIRDAIQNEYSLYLTDKTLDLSYYELPPTPPTGIPDVRFVSNRFIENINEHSIININSLAYPIEVYSPDFDMEIGSTIKNDLTHLRKNEIIKYSNPSFNQFKIVPSVSIETYALYQNYPNPFNPVTNISFTIPEETNVKITIYDPLGRETQVLRNEITKPGKYSISWDASKYSSGIYYLELKTKNFSQKRKMILIK